MKISTVTVIGANGAMGTNVSALFASFGNAKVYLVCRKMEDAKQAVQKAIASVRADAIADNLIAASYDQLAVCLRASDLVFESVSENIKIKKDINRLINTFCRDDTIIATGTSGLSINALSQNFEKTKQKNFLGMHFFNPPYHMTLCEVIPSQSMEQTMTDEIKQYLSSTLLRTVVQLKDTPAFLGNRIGFQFINEALIYAEKYQDNGGIDYIDAILGVFSGRSMSPIVTSDFVGLDVHKAIVDNVYQHTLDYAHETFALPTYVQNLINENKLGKKTGQGFYQTIMDSHGKKQHLVYDIATGQYRPKENYHFMFAERMRTALQQGDYQEAFQILKTNHSAEAGTCLSFLLKYIVYSLYCAGTTGDNVSAADAVMATGFNWAPALSIVEALGGAKEVQLLLKKQHLQLNLSAETLTALFEKLPASQYDYRPFFKAK